MGEELSVEAKAALSRELVLVCGPDEGEAGALYTHEEFLGAFQDALLERISSSIPSGASVRTALRVLSGLRSPEAYRATLAGALLRLKKSGRRLDPSAIRDRPVVATFAANA